MFQKNVLRSLEREIFLVTRNLPNLKFVNSEFIFFISKPPEMNPVQESDQSRSSSVLNQTGQNDSTAVQHKQNSSGELPNNHSSHQDTAINFQSNYFY